MSTLIFTSLKQNKTSIIKHSVLLFLITCCITAFAKNPAPNAFTVKGRVIDKNEIGLAGATVSEKGTTNSTSTAADGSFTINLSQPSTLVITYVGYQSREIFVRAATSDLTVTLNTVSGAMESVIVVGYGTQRKITSTVAVSTVKGEQLAQVPAANISNSLAGRTSGIITRANGGRPGGDNQTIYIRGASTTGNASPLIVVDGVPRNNINEIDPNNIETVTVLKDAAAVAPYGLGGANGVILITTKRGTAGAPTISFGGYYGDQQPTYLPKMLNAIDYMKLKLEAYVTENPTGTNPTYSQAYIDSYMENHSKNPDLYPVSDALNDVVRKHSPMYQGNLQVRGGNQIIKYFAGVSYFQQEGMFDRSAYNRYNYNLNFDVNVTPTTMASFSLNGGIQKTTDVDGGTGQLFRGVYKFLPIAPLRYTIGLAGENSGNSPIGVINSTGYFRQNTNNLLSTVAIEQKLPFIKGLSLKGTVSYDPYNFVQKQWHRPFTYYSQNTSTTPYTYTPGFSTQENSAATYSWLNQQYWQQNTLTLQGYINYRNSFGKSEVTGLVVAERRSAKQFDFSARRNNFAVDIDELGLGSSKKDDFDNGGGSGTSSQVGYVYRAGYSYDRKYLFEASGRYDGHYYFAPGKRWVYLPAFSVGWVISNEKFFEPVSFVDNLKLRGSWGKSGNLAGQPWQFLNAYSLRGNAYAYGDGGLVQGSFLPRENNPDITWEEAKKTDVGLEASLWKGALHFEADYFYEKRSNMLVNPTIVVPQEYGISLSQENKGVMDNRGFEVSLGTTKRLQNGLQFSIDGNFTYAKNKLIQTFENSITKNNPHRSRTGRRNGTVFGYHSLGLFTTADDKNGDGKITSADGYTVTQFGTLRPGDIRYADIDGQNGTPDGKIDSYDEMPIANPQTPAIIYGLNIAANWKGFDLSGLFQGSGMSGYNVYGFMTVAHFNNNSNSAYEYYNNRWTPDRQNAKYPRAYSAPSNNNGQSSDFWYRNSSYLRLKTASLGYTVPARISSKVRMKNLRVYVTGQNILTFSKIKFTDPETNGEQGYPIQKTFLIGFNTSF